MNLTYVQKLSFFKTRDPKSRFILEVHRTIKLSMLRHKDKDLYVIMQFK